MKTRPTQFGMRRRTASPRRLVLRLVMFDLTEGFFRLLAESSDTELPSSDVVRTTRTLELPLHEEIQGTTGGGKTLDAADLNSIRNMFQLLDQWDCAIGDDVL